MSKPVLVTEEGVRMAPLSSLSDFQVAEGHRDIRGWRVNAADGREVGRVHDLIVDLDTMRTRYIDVRLHSDVAAADGDRDVLVPTGSARVENEATLVTIPLSVDRITLLPPFDHRNLMRTHESEIRRHFALGDGSRPAETRVPIDPQDSVVLERGPDGHDEVIIRRPTNP